MVKIKELHLEPEYLRVFHFVEWRDLNKIWGIKIKPLPGKKEMSKEEEERFKNLKGERAEEFREKFKDIFDKQFRGDNNYQNYLLPFIFTFITTLAIAFICYDILALNSKYRIVADNLILIYSMMGALLYIYPHYVTKYASYSLNPPVLFELLGRLWLAIILGVVSASVAHPTLQTATAFLGGLLPLASIELLKKKIFEDKASDDGDRVNTMLEILHGDRNILSQFEYIGVRSVLELAYENPLRLFVQTDLNLVTCFDMVDQANLYLYVPDKNIRQELNQYGIRTGIDLMTQLDIHFPSKEDKSIYEDRYIEQNEPLPKEMEEPMAGIAKVLKVENVGSLRNLIQMMKDNPQLKYLGELWATLNSEVDKSTVED
jgi:hypothetical protein